MFGSLDDFPFPEVITILDRRCGKLELTDLPKGRSYELYVADGNLRGLVATGLLVDDMALAREHLTLIMVARQGRFRFIKAPPEALEGRLNLPLQRVLLNITVTLDEMARYREHFADPRTCFQVAQPRNPLPDAEMDQFWQASYGYFSQHPFGANAHQISQHLRMSVVQAQYKIYKLRAAGLLAPVRASAPIPPIQANPNPLTAPAHLRPTAQVVSAQPTAQAIQVSALAADHSPQPHTERSGVTASLVNRLLTALRWRAT